ncbi:MAG: DNA recombination protein RmuC [Oligoflexus sp.]
MIIDWYLWLVAGLGIALLPMGFMLMRRQQQVSLLEQKSAEQDKANQQLQQNLHSIQEQLEEFRNKFYTGQSRIAALEAELQMEKVQHEDRIKVYEATENRLKDVFKVMSVDALKTNHQGLMQIAESLFTKYEAQVSERFERKEEAIANLVKPVYQTLDKFEVKVQELEKQRVGAYEGLSQQVQNLVELQHRLQTETNQLANALRSPTARGKWGELQLRRVVELAGMMAHCNFYEQSAVSQENSSNLRPDMIIKLPGERSIVVDAKVPLRAYLEAMESSDEKQRLHLFKEHATLIRKQIQSLSQKAYWERLDGSPEFVLLFLPAESHFSAALQVDPQLIEAGVQNKVILATPTTLIALLRTTAYAWRQEAMNENARLVADLGKELYCRIADLSGHFHDMGRHLKQSVESYNKAVGTLESRVLVSARRFQELKVDDPKKSLKDSIPLEVQPRELLRTRESTLHKAEQP